MGGFKRFLDYALASIMDENYIYLVYNQISVSIYQDLIQDLL